MGIIFRNTCTARTPQLAMHKGHKNTSVHSPQAMATAFLEIQQQICNVAIAQDQRLSQHALCSTHPGCIAFGSLALCAAGWAFHSSGATIQAIHEEGKASNTDGQS